MADLSRNTKERYEINGERVNAAIDWQDSKIKANYKNDSIQPSVDIESFKFSNEARLKILQWIEQGRIFEGLPLAITLYNINRNETFNSIIDFTKGYTDFVDDGIVEVGITEDLSLDLFFERIQTVSFGYLESIGVITSSDYTTIDYVVEKRVNFVEIIATSIVIYLMIKEIQESIARTARDIATISGIASGSITGTVGAVIYAAASALLNVIYTVAMVIAIVNLANSLFQYLLPPRRQSKVANLTQLFTKVCNSNGYGFVTSFTEMNKVAHYPSNINADDIGVFGNIESPKGTQSGIPNTADPGYIVGDMFEYVKQLCDGKYAIIDGNIHLHSKSSDFWIQQSTYEFPSNPPLIIKKEYNLDQLNSTNILGFATDINDEFTIDEYRGTQIEVITDLINPTNQNNVLLKGLSDVQIPFALGTRKNKLNALEKTLQVLASTIDSATSVLGRGTRFESKIKSRVGLLKMTSNWNSVPKLIYLEGTSIPTNHRDLFSAPVLWNKYHQDKSFVSNNFRSQKVVYNGVEIPFGLEDFNKLKNNSYFTYKGIEAKIINFEWIKNQDKAIVDFWVREVYTRNLKEIIRIPE